MTRWVSMLGIAVAGTVACAPQADSQVDTAVAHGFTTSVERVSRQDAIGYARRLRFDSTYARADVRQLVWRERGRYVVGPFAEIAPERHAHRLTDAQLARGAIIARVRTTGPITPLGIPTGVSYLWVEVTDRVRRLVVIPEATSEPLRQLPLGIRVHTDTVGRPLLSRASFLLEAGGGIQVPCKPYGCCCVEPGGGIPCDPPVWQVPGPGRIDFADLIGPRITVLRPDTVR